MRSFFKSLNETGNLEASITLFCGVLMVGLILAFAMSQGTPKAEAGNPTYPPREQVRGHISSDDLRDGVTSFTITAQSGHKVDCIYIQDFTSQGMGMDISCDWGNTR